MIGKGYWTSGIVATPAGKVGKQTIWICGLTYQDEGFGVPDSTQGQLTNRYGNANLLRQVEILKKDAERLGIKMISPNGEVRAALYIDGDGDNPDSPEGWQDLLIQIAAQTGLEYPYRMGR